MSLRRIALSVLYGTCAVLHAQVDSAAWRYGNTITSEDLMRHLRVLASDAYEGRDTGQRGQKMAAAYLREQFKAFGIPEVPAAAERGLVEGYYQPFTLEMRRPGGIVVKVEGTPYRFMEGMFYFTERLEQDLLTQEVVVIAAPPGAPATDLFGGQDLKGRAVLVLDRGGDDGLLDRMRELATVAEAGGASVLLLAPSDYAGVRDAWGHYISGARMRLAGSAREERRGRRDGSNAMQVIVAGPQLAADLVQRTGLDPARLGRQARRKKVVAMAAVDIVFNATPLVSKVISENVLGYVEGGDLKDELVVVTAHYDHIGVEGGEVYNGADDDGSGTVALLEMAEAFARAKAEGHGPRRSILFMPVSAEEKGLLGSQYYSEHPVFPLERTIADLNIDMIGRRDSAHAEGPAYVYVIGSDRMSTELHTINEQANTAYTGLELDYTFNAPEDPNRYYYRSDHYNFTRNGVPAIFYFSGVHEDYHGPGDEVDKILPELLQQRSRLVFHTAWALANRPERIVVDRPEGGK